MAHYFFDIKFGGVNRDFIGHDYGTKAEAIMEAETMVNEIRAGMKQLRPNVFISVVDKSGSEVSRHLVSTPCDEAGETSASVRSSLRGEPATID